MHAQRIRSNLAGRRLARASLFAAIVTVLSGPAWGQATRTERGLL